jgi:hypothetical protein
MLFNDKVELVLSKSYLVEPNTDIKLPDLSILVTNPQAAHLSGLQRKMGGANAETELILK